MDEMTIEDYRKVTSMCRKKIHPKQNEFEEQCALFDWIYLNETKYPELKYAFATFNGIRLTPNLAIKAKRSGNRKGVPDVWLPVHVDGYTGLCFEMKIKPNKLTPEQKEFLDQLFYKENWMTGVCYSADEAIQLIKNYLEGNCP
ncbi:MAG: VRR-NUC domain-containing protein [Anaerolineaceae bacterium]|nr:VRR-NUC domain-containing protein [Anaerolineaceae bacterium]